MRFQSPIFCAFSPNAHKGQSRKWGSKTLTFWSDYCIVYQRFKAFLCGWRKTTEILMWTRSVSWSFENTSFPKEALYRLFILLNFFYCSQVWHHCGTKNTSKLKKVNELVLRFFFFGVGVGKRVCYLPSPGHISPWRDICPVCFFLV